MSADKDKNALVVERLTKLKKAAAAFSVKTAGNAKLKDDLLRALAKKISEGSEYLLQANALDLHALNPHATPAFRERLMLTPERIKAMSTSLLEIAGLPDPVGEVVHHEVLENGLDIKKVRAPLGVIFLIFESRPNVAVDAFALALKSGNGLVLKSGRESAQTVAVLYEWFLQSLNEYGLPSEVFWGLGVHDRELIPELLKQNKFIDVVIPRGGEELIEFVAKHASIPVIKNDRGLCHVYVDASADEGMAASIVENAKASRPGVCNAMETLLIHESVAADFLPKIFKRLQSHSVTWNCCEQSYKILMGASHLDLGLIKRADSWSFDREYLDFEMNCLVVKNLEQAIEHIAIHGSKHSESIISASAEAAREFEARVDAAVVYWNASTRFTDGGALGLGGEIGISTQKLHVRGPVSLRELTAIRWVVEGSGQIRK